MGCCTSSSASGPDAEGDSPVLITRQASSPIDASKEQTDEWWAAQREARASEAHALEALESEPVLAPPEAAPPPETSTRRSRASSTAPAKAKHMTTSQLKAKIRGMGVELEDGLSRSDMEDLLKLAERDAAVAEPELV